MFVKRFALGTLFILMINTSFASTSDPFIKGWKYTDGSHTFLLNVTKGENPWDYAIDYVLPTGEQGSSGMCRKTSATAVFCKGTNDNLTLNAKDFSLRLDTSYSGSYIYYDADHMPVLDPIIGKWSYQSVYNPDKTVEIDVAPGPSDTQFYVKVFDCFKGDDCQSSYILPFIYDQVVNADGTKIFSIQQGTSYHSSFKYNPTTQQISNPDPMATVFELVDVYLMDKDAQAIFTKAIAR